MKICVYCSAAEDLNPEYYSIGSAFGRELALRGHALVYGGYNKGIMGAVARGVMDEHGEIIGVVPKIFDRPDFTFEGCSKVIYTETMSDRKAAMEQACDAFAILPGGIGTFDELFEALCLKSLGKLSKPIAILNVRHCYDLLQAMLNHNVEEGFQPGFKKYEASFFESPSELFDFIEKS